MGSKLYILIKKQISFVIKIWLAATTYWASQKEENLDQNGDYKIATILAIFALSSNYLMQYSAIMGLTTTIDPVINDENPGCIK